MEMGHSDYHASTYTPAKLKGIVNRVIKNLNKLRKTVPFDAIAFAGSSGASIAYPVSVIGGFKLIYVRKPYERSHGEKIEATRGDVKRYIILDDFVHSGTTVLHIVYEINKLVASIARDTKTGFKIQQQRAVCVGLALYNEGGERQPRCVVKDMREQEGVSDNCTYHKV